MRSAWRSIRRSRTELGDYLIENCFLHDTANPIFPDAAKNEGRAHNDYRNMGWAIFADGFESPAPVHLKNLTVRNCCGLRTQGFFMPMGPVSLDNVLFEGNTVSHNSFNSVYQIGAKGFDIIDSVFVYGYPWEFHPNGTTQVLAGGVTGDATVRNEVRNNEFGWAGDYPGRPDGCAYDFEGSTGSVTFQNNFVHDTFGEAVLFMPGCKHNDLIFDGNIFRNNVRFSPTWNVEVTLFPDNTGNGTLSNNIFFPRPGKKAINSKPACFTFTNNDENATGRSSICRWSPTSHASRRHEDVHPGMQDPGSNHPLHHGWEPAHNIQHAIHRSGDGRSFGSVELQGFPGRLLRQLRQLRGSGFA